MNVETFCLGELDTNAYVVTDGGSGDCWLFDCPGGPGALVDALRGRNARLRGVYLTHAHVDHLAGLEELRRAFPGVPVAVHEAEAGWLGDPRANLSEFMAGPVAVEPAELRVADGDRLVLGPFSVRVLHLPGHSPGSCAYWFEDHDEVFSGDVLFRGGVGRWDFPGSSGPDLRKSLARLTALPDQVRVRPGHGGSTTIGREKTSNPYLRSDEAWR